MEGNLHTGDDSLDVRRLGQCIARFRELRGLSSTGLAEKAQIAKSYVYKLERGEAENPGLKTLDALARALDITLFDLLAAAGQGTTDMGDALRSETADVERLLIDAPEELRVFIAELEAKEGPLPLDVLRSLASLQLRGKRPQTLEDWRFAYDSLSRAVR